MNNRNKKKAWKLIRLGLVGASLYYGGKREMPQALQGISVVGSLASFVMLVGELFEA